MLRQREPEDLAPWLEEAEASGLAELGRFAAGLRRDEAAVRAALSLPYRNGRTEGRVNRLKLVKRQGCGRAGFDLLRRRVLGAASQRFSRRLIGERVAAVGEEAPDVGGADRPQRLADGLDQGLAGAGRRRAQQGLQLGEGLLDGREVRGAGRPKTSSAPRASTSSCARAPWWAAKPPVSRRRRSQRRTVGSGTAKVAQTSSRRVPRSTAASTRSRRSAEYGFTPGRVAPAQEERKRL